MLSSDCLEELSTLFGAPRRCRNPFPALKPIQSLKIANRECPLSPHCGHCACRYGAAMCLARAVLILASGLWGFFALSGFGAMSDIASQGVPGYPNSGQRQYYLYIPLFMAGTSLLLFAGALWKPRLATIAACIAAIIILLLPPYLFFYTGGV